MESILNIDIEKKMMTSEGVVNLVIQTTVTDGELLTLFGASGAGKTTLLRMLAGLTLPDKGVISFGKSEWYNSQKKINVSPQQRNIGFMFQDYALFPNMTIEQNITFAQSKKDSKKVADLLSIFALNELKKRKPNELSGGQKQRVALARALACNPKLLLLDEPLSALDIEMRNALQYQIAQAHSLLGSTTIMVSHDLNEVFRLATKVICIESGKISRSGTPEEVFCNSSVSGKVQITGQIARIEPIDGMYIITVIFGNNQIMKVIAFESDKKELQIGDNVMVYTKAFNPLITKIN
jgi:molybdate transport system ATP-binding protein